VSECASCVPNDAFSSHCYSGGCMRATTARALGKRGWNFIFRPLLVRLLADLIYYTDFSTCFYTYNTHYNNNNNLCDTTATVEILFLCPRTELAFQACLGTRHTPLCACSLMPPVLISGGSQNTAFLNKK